MREPFNSPLNFVESFAWAANDVGVPPLLVSNCCAFDLPLTRLPLVLSPAFALLMLFMLLLLLVLVVVVVLILLLKLNLECVVTIDFGDVSVLSELSLFYLRGERGRQREEKEHDYHRSEYEIVFILRSWRFGQINHSFIIYAIIPLNDAVGRNGDRLLTFARNNGACTRLRNESNALILLRGKHLFLLISLVILVAIIVWLSTLQNWSTAFRIPGERKCEELSRDSFFQIRFQLLLLLLLSILSINITIRFVITTQNRDELFIRLISAVLISNSFGIFLTCEIFGIKWN